MEKYFSVLESCPLFRNISREDIPGMLACLGGTVHEAKKEQQLLREGDAANYVGILLKGSAHVVNQDYYGNRTIVARVEPGELFGESFACAGVSELPDREIQELLLSEWRRGVTQRQIADRANLTDAYINNLLSGKRKVETMKLETLFKLFPNAEISLNGANIATDHANLTINGGGDFEKNVEKIINDDTLSAEEKIKFIKVLKRVEK